LGSASPSASLPAASGQRALALAAGLVSIGVLLILFKLHVTSALNIVL